MKKLSLIFFLVVFLFSRGDARSELSTLTSRMKDLRYTAELDSVRYYFRQALPLALKINDSLGVFDLYKYMGDAYEHHDFTDSTLIMYASCEKYIPFGNIDLRSFLLNDEAYTYRNLGDHEKSTSLLLESMTLIEQGKDAHQLIISCLGVAGEFSEMKMNARAKDYYLRAMEKSEKLKDINAISYSHRYYAIHLLANAESGAAYKHLKIAERYSVLKNDSISLANVWFYTANYYSDIKKPDSALYFSMKAMGIWERRKEESDLSLSYLQAGKISRVLLNYLQAELYLKKAEQRISNNEYFNEELYQELSQLYDQTGDVRSAYKYLGLAKKMSESIRAKERQTKILGLRIKFDADKKEREIDAERQKNALSVIEIKSRTGQRNTVIVALLFAALLLGVIVFLYFKVRNKNKLLNSSNVKLENLVSQKQTLLKEVHHRVKNNLTTLKSLFYLQAKSSDKEEVKHVLEECQLRIQSMALIHQNLYEENESDKLEFRHFLIQLFNDLELSIKPADLEIEFQYIGDEVHLDVSKALFLGLIINELATNSFKYAFENCKAGRIAVELRQEPEKLVVLYTDTGCGLPDGVELSKGGFGFRLIRILIDQVDATMAYTRLPEVSQFKIELSNEK